MISVAKYALTLLAIIVFAGASFAQLATGTPPLSSLGGGPFDIVDFGNDNVHFNIPILNKGGRGIPFSYAVTYDSLNWQAVTSGSTTAWEPVNPNWGWSAQSTALTGSVMSAPTVLFCHVGSSYYSYPVTQYNGYIDPAGTSHPTTPFNITAGQASCGVSAITSGSGTSTDGSGYTLSVTGTGSTVTVAGPNGTVVQNPGQNGATIADRNGNYITTNISGTSSFTDTYTDTLGTTALTVAGTVPATSTTYSYTPPSGVTTNYTFTYAANQTVTTSFGCSGISEYSNTHVSQLTSISLPDGSSYSFAYDTAGRIKSVTLPTGGTITYTYSGIVCGDGTPLKLARVTPDGPWTYDRSGSNSTLAGNVVTDPAGDVTTLTFWKDQATTNPTGNFYEVQRLAYQGNSTLLSTTDTCYNGVDVNSPNLCPVTSVSSPITRKTVFTYLPNTTGTGAETDITFYSTSSPVINTGLPSEEDDYDYGTAGSGSPGPLLRKTITAYNSSLTNGIVEMLSSVTIKDGSNNTKAFTSYTYDGTSVTTTSGTPQHTAITGSRGNLTTVAAQANSSGTTLYRQFAYYDTGMLNTSTNTSTSSTINGATTTYNYASGTASCGNSFVTSISEPLSLSRSMQWNCTGGVLTQVSDENSQPTTTSYTDPYFWRPYSATDASGAVTTFNYISQNQVESTMLFNSGNSVTDQLTTLDGLGRMIFSQTKEGPSASDYDTVGTCYDNLGRSAFASVPYSATAATSTTACPSASEAGTSTTYDALSRPYTVTDGGGGIVTSTYTGKDTLQVITPAPTGESVKQKQYEYDGLGRLTSVCEITGGSGSGSCGQYQAETGYWTKYAYDGLSNLTGVTQNAQGTSQTRTYAYDFLSRLTSETNPETANTATTYAYDSDSTCTAGTLAGNLLNRTDGAGNVTCTAYDALHRPTSITYPSGPHSTSTDRKYYVYDSATVDGSTMQNVKARLADAYTCPPSGSCSTKKTDLGFSYTARGSISDVYEATPNSGTYYYVNATYGSNYALKSLSGNIGLPTETYSWDGEGRPTAVSASSGQNPITSAAYNANSQVYAMTYGSGDNDVYTHDHNTWRFTGYQYNVGSSPQTDQGTLTWNANGTLQQLVVSDSITGTSDSQTCTYSYDDLARVASGNCGASIFNQTFSYDPFGNISKYVPSGSVGMAFNSQTYSTSTNQIISSPFAYDGNEGNMTNDGVYTYGWDAEGKLVTVDSGLSTAVCITYDALGRMVEKGTGSGCSAAYKQVVYSPLGNKLAMMAGSTLSKAYVRLPGGAEAEYTSSGLVDYRHPDWLGSSRLMTTPSQTLYYSVDYAPFGEPYAGSGTQDLSFTGENLNTESATVPGGAGGLYDFLARRQSPVQGRWLSPDPAGLAATNPANPQSWNRYAYVMNNPLSYTDPLGLFTTVAPPPPSCDGGNSSACNFDFFDFCSITGLCNNVVQPPPTPLIPPNSVAPDLPLPPVLKRGQPQCFAQLKYRSALAGQNHSFWWTQTSDQHTYIISGGPTYQMDLPYAPMGYLNSWVNVGNTGTHFPADNSSDATAWNSGVSSSNCSAADDLLNSGLQWPQNTIPYNPFGTNSNTLAQQVGDDAGFTPTAPPNAIGWQQ